MEQPEHRHGCHEASLGFGLEWTGYEASTPGDSAVAGFLCGGAFAQSPSNDKDAIPPRSIQLTAEQDHVIKEIVKDMHIEPVRGSSEIRIGEKVPPNIELQSFPPLAAEKVPQIRTYKFFVSENQVVVVSPQNIIADILK